MYIMTHRVFHKCPIININIPPLPHSMYLNINPLFNSNECISYPPALDRCTSLIRPPSPYMYFSPCAVDVHAAGGRGRCCSGGGWDRTEKFLKS
jgi:hypothetical protein